MLNSKKHLATLILIFGIAIYFIIQKQEPLKTTDGSYNELTPQENTLGTATSTTKNKQQEISQTYLTTENTTPDKQATKNEQANLAEQSQLTKCSPELKRQVQELFQKFDYESPFDPTSIEQGETRLNASYEYLNLLGQSELESFARQGYRDAMVVLGEQLISKQDPEHQAQGRDLLYEAGVLGSAYALAGLSGNYYAEYLRLSDNGDVEKSKASYLDFHKIKNLIEKLEPLPTQTDPDFEIALINVELASIDEIRDAQTKSLTEFNKKRIDQGLAEIGTGTNGDQLYAKGISADLEACLRSNWRELK